DALPISYADNRDLLSYGICSGYVPKAAAEQESVRKFSIERPPPGSKKRAAARWRPPTEGNRTLRYFFTWPDSISPDHLPVGVPGISMNPLKRFRSFSTLLGVACISVSPASPTIPAGGS